MFTLAKLSGHFSTCFESQVHQVEYMCSEELRGTRARFLAMDRVLSHIRVRTQYAEDIFKGKLCGMKNAAIGGLIGLTVNTYPYGEFNDPVERP